MKTAIKVVATSGVITYVNGSDDGKETAYGDGDTLLAINVQDSGIRQKARISAHQILGHNAPKEVKIKTERELTPEEEAVLREEFGGDDGTMGEEGD